MPRSLYAKLSLALIGLLILIGVVFLVVSRYATDNYYQEITQRLNGPIAMYVAAERPLIVDGAVDAEAVAALAHQAMIINPTVEVYVLDAGGRILAHGLPQEAVLRDRVSLAPIRAFLSGSAELPLRNDDPRKSGASKIFSVAPIGAATNPDGYVYAVLGGQKYEAIARSLEQSYVLKLTLAVIGAVLLFSLLTGLLIFHALTRRLRQLDTSMQRFREDALGERAELVKAAAGSDEIDSLGASFDALSQQILRQIAHLKDTDATRRDLISNVSHDLRTPLASMQGYIETLLIRDDRLSDAERREYLEVAARHAAHLNRLVCELFELTKLENLSMIPASEPFSIAELLQDIGQEFELQARQKRICLHVDEPQDNVYATGDIGLIQRVLENLIENALRHTPAGGSVRIGLTPGSRHVEVTVADSGCGIRSEQVSRIFERFYRAGGATGSGQRSAGLGLAIVKRILELHNSTIRVASEVNVGTSFTFDLPRPQRVA